MFKHGAEVTLEGRPVKIGKEYRVPGQRGYRYGHTSVPLTYLDTGEHVTMAAGKLMKALRKEQRS